MQKGAYCLQDHLSKTGVEISELKSCNHKCVIDYKYNGGGQSRCNEIIGTYVPQPQDVILPVHIHI